MSSPLRRAIVVVLLLCMIAPFTTVYADDPGGAAMPPMEKLFKELKNNKYLTTYRDHYFLDMKKYSLLKDPEGVLNLTANMLFTMQYLAGYLLVTVFYFAFEIDLYALFSPLVNTFIKEMEISLFKELSVVAICLLGLYYIIKIYQDQKTQIWVAILQTVIIVALSVQFFYNPLAMLKSVDEGSKYISKVILAGTYKASVEGRDPNSAVSAAANDIWMVFVHKPWQLLEFGNISLAEKEQDRILALPPRSAERQKIIEELAKDEIHFTPIWGAKRTGFMLLYFIPMLVMFLVILVLALLMLAYQLLTIMYALMGPFIFILALIPFFGIKVVQNWFMKIIGSGSIKAVVTLCMGLLFAFNSALFKLMDVYGWFMILILQLLVAVVLVWKREALFETFTTLRLAPQNIGALNKQMRRDTNVEHYMREYSKGLSFRKNKNSDHTYSKSNDASGLEERMLQAAQIEMEAGRKKWAILNQQDFMSEHPKNQNSTLNSNGGFDSFDNFDNFDNNESSNNNENFRNLMKKAEEILERQYEISKIVAEDKAQKQQKEPDYTPFVYKTMTREQLGAPKFDQREIIAVAKDLERIIKAGGVTEDYYKKEIDQAANAVERPKNVIDIVVEGQKTPIDQEEAQKIIIEDTSQKYTNEFNGDYDTKYDQQFMKGLIKEFGDKQVRLVLDRMRDIQSKEGKIQNPAGYLTKSLKNNKRDNVGLRKKSYEDPFEGSAEE